MKFYLQRIGDPLLQPLESANIKVFDDQYRILAQSSLKNGQEVDITVYYHHPTHPQQYHYHQQINDEGNVVILPPTYLHSGRWEIYCCSDLVSELVGDYWQTSLNLQVEKQPSLSSQIKQNQGDLSEKVTPLPPEILETKVNLILDSEEITRQWGEAIAITGQIEIENTRDDIDCLQYKIIDPLTQDCLYQQKQLLNGQSSFLAFQHHLNLPEDMENPTLELIAEVFTVTGESCDRQTLTIYTEMPEIETEDNEYLQYTLELSDLETQISYTFDIAIEKPLNSLPMIVDLPDPQKSGKFLRRVQKSRQSSLPPRLFKDNVNSSRLPLQLPEIV